MERLVIIDHANHKLVVDDVSEETLQQYDGEEEKYIEDNYTFDGDYSWDFITDAEYYPTDFEYPLEIELEKEIKNEDLINLHKACDWVRKNYGEEAVFNFCKVME